MDFKKDFCFLYLKKDCNFLTFMKRSLFIVQIFQNTNFANRHLIHFRRMILEESHKRTKISAYLLKLIEKYSFKLHFH